MIVLTRLNRTQFAVNPDLIERINAAPDTTLVMVDGTKLNVRESMTEVIDLADEWRARIIARARDIPSEPVGRPVLGVVTDDGSPHQRATPVRTRSI